MHEERESENTRENLQDSVTWKFKSDGSDSGPQQFHFQKSEDLSLPTDVPWVLSPRYWKRWEWQVPKNVLKKSSVTGTLNACGMSLFLKKFKKYVA